MRVFITGATGLVGQRLVADRLARGDEVVALSRDVEKARRALHRERGGEEAARLTIVQGDPTIAGDWQAALAGCRAVVHLAGAGVADRRWTAAYKRTLVSSRVDSTREIVRGIKQAMGTERPRVLVSASATGFYGERGEQELDERAAAPRPPHDDSLSRLAEQWEQEAIGATSVTDPPVRVVLLRTGVVLDERGGALRKMLPIFRLGLGGPLGSGRQFMPWIHWRDLIGLIDMAIMSDRVQGPLNAVAPGVVRQGDFARALGRALGRPAMLPTPSLALRVVLGELAPFTMMSQRVVPARALQCGFQFVHPDVDSALADLVGRRGQA